MDFTGMSPEAIHEVGRIMSDSQFVGFMYLLVIVLVVFGFIAAIMEVRKSKKYRQFKADMFVAARIGQLADNYKLDLDIEEQKFKKWSKKERRESRRMELDDIIEEDLSEKIAEDNVYLGNLDKKTPKNKQDTKGE